MAKTRAPRPLSRHATCPQPAGSCICQDVIFYVRTAEGTFPACLRSGVELPSGDPRWGAPSAYAQVDCTAPAAAEQCMLCPYYDNLLLCRKRPLPQEKTES